MDAANFEAFILGALSLGQRIYLPQYEEKANPYIHQLMFFDKFYSRISTFYSSYWHVITQGGVGTLQEFFSLYASMILGKLPHYPLVFYNQDIFIPGTAIPDEKYKGEKFWDGLVQFIQQVMCEEFKLVRKEDLKLFTVATQPAQVAEALDKFQSQPVEETEANYKQFNTYIQEHHSLPELEKTPYEEITDMIKEMSESKDPETLGIYKAYVHYVNNNQVLMPELNNKHFHTVAELMAAENLLNTEPKSITFCMPRTLTHETGEIAAELRSLLPHLQSPIAFTHSGKSTQLASAEIKNKNWTTFDLTKTAEKENPQLTEHRSIIMKRYDIFKTIILNHSKALIFSPCDVEGFDEFFEVLCLIQNQKLKGENAPKIMVIDKNGYFSKLEKMVIDKMIATKMVNENFKSLYIKVKTPAEAVELADQY